jgi:carbon starvation protein CstA
MAEFLSKYSRRTVALFWVALLAIMVGILLYFEQVAVLYVLATIGLVALLAIVGTADLEKVGRENAE